MAETVHRYNAGTQRAKGLLEMASALYDTSLSHETVRPGVRQVDSRVGTHVELSLGAIPGRMADAVSVSFRAGGFRAALEAVARGDVSLHWINPSAALTMAVAGTGPFKEPLALRPIAVFPSWDVMGFAVHGSTGITSLEQIAQQRPALNLSTRTTIEPPFDEDGTMFTVDAVLSAAGFSLADIRAWGGTIQPVSRPSDAARLSGIASGAVNAVFDEGIKTWAGDALEHGFRFLPVEGVVRERLTAMGFRPVTMTPAQIPGLPEDVPTLDFSGWPMVVHADMAEDVAYALCEAIALRTDAIPTDNGLPVDMAQLCGDELEAPLDVPLHPGAERFYRERGFLK